MDKILFSNSFKNLMVALGAKTSDSSYAVPLINKTSGAPQGYMEMSALASVLGGMYKWYSNSSTTKYLKIQGYTDCFAAMDFQITSLMTDFVQSGTIFFTRYNTGTGNPITGKIAYCGATANNRALREGDSIYLKLDPYTIVGVRVSCYTGNLPNISIVDSTSATQELTIASLWAGSNRDVAKSIGGWMYQGVFLNSSIIPNGTFAEMRTLGLNGCYGFSSTNLTPSDAPTGIVDGVVFHQNMFDNVAFQIIVARNGERKSRTYWYGTWSSWA